MCGIAGILSSNPANITGTRLQKMTDAIAHRGPDGEGAWINPSGIAGLAHRRLSIIDLTTAGSQPMHYLDRYTITYNGEIYNYLELKEHLQSRGYRFVTKTDTEVILAAYDHYGPGCLQHFDGMFAFAIWDERKEELFLARDRFGEKPLFFYRDDTQLIFASEMKALWAVGIEKESNNTLLFNFLTIGYTQNPANGFETFYNGISKLQARSFLLCKVAHLETETSVYWDIGIANCTDLGDEDVRNRFSTLFASSVAKRMRSDVPVGASLSGGLDSSAIVANVLRQGTAPQDFHTFSAVFPGFDRDESPFVNLLTNQFSLSNHGTTPHAQDLIRDFERLVYHQEEPFNSSSIYAQYNVYNLAQRHHVKVLLDGQGADEVLAGYLKYYHWYWQELYCEDKKTFRLERDAARQSGIHEHWTWQNTLAATWPVQAGLFLKNRASVRQRKNPALHKDFVHDFGVSYYDIPHLDRLNGVLYYNTLMNGLEELLRYADRNSMAHGVEVRLPFLDHELVEFLFQLPSRFKIRGGWTKWLLRTSLQGLLPEQIVWRKDKTGYEPPQRSWMKNPVLEEYIHEARRSLVKARVLQPAVLQKKIQPQDAHAAENSDWRYLVTAACLNL